MWQLSLFGGFNLDGAHRLSGRATQRKRQALLALLGSGQTAQVSRDRLIALLWPDSDTERARHQLASSVYDLRRVLGEDTILTIGDDLRLNRALIRSDAREFEELVAAGDFAAAVVLRTGPFLDGFHLADAPELSSWVDSERDRFERLYAQAIERLADAASARGDFAEAARWLQQLATHEPHNSRVALAYMGALDRAGDSAGAIRYARTHELLVQQEFGVAADPQIGAFVAELRARTTPGTASIASPRATEDVMVPSVTISSAAGPRRRHRWPIAVAAGAALVVAVVALYAGGGKRVPDRSIAVLPFKSMGGGEENAYFAEGMHEDLLTHLARIEDLKVISRTSVQQYRESRSSIRDIARELGVAVVLEGSVRREGNRVRVVAQLIDARNDAHLWGETYDRELSDVFEVQTSIAREIARLLDTDARSAEPASTGIARPRVTAAYDSYLRARSLVYSTPVGEIDYPRAQQLLESAVRADSQFALAYAELTRLHAGMYWVAIDASPARAKAAADALEQALRWGRNLPETRLAAGYYYYWVRMDYERALIELQRAHEQLPGSAEILHMIGVIHRRRGDMNAAVAYLSSAAQRDPARSLPFTYLAESLYMLGRFEEANTVYRQALAKAPDDAYTMRLYGDMYIAWRGTTDTLRAVARRMAPASRSFGGIPTAEFRVAMLSRDCAGAAAAVDSIPERAGTSFFVLPGALYRGWAAECSGDEQIARQHFRAAEPVAREIIAEKTLQEAAGFLGLAHALAGQGRLAEAVSAGRRAVTLMPYERDAMAGGHMVVDLAAIHVRASQFEDALDLLERSCGRPYGVWPQELQLDRRWDALRGQARFETLTRVNCGRD
jgi:TolB-like protein/DNA-binding SARP family transcriptional activator